ncbi:MAG: hypothetical protein ABJH04_14330 [Cyclobacteriaceae bacterium]
MVTGKFTKTAVIIFVLVALLLESSLAQINAITESGDEVLLYEDGKWAYKDHDVVSESEISTNDEIFLKDEKSTFLVKSNKVNVGVWINPKLWRFEKGDGDNEYLFTLKNEDLYAMFITERIAIPLDILKTAALSNAKDAASNVKIVKEEYRNVNESKVLMIQLSGTIQGIEFIYYGYYFSNEGGTVQLITYTSKNLFDDYLGDMDNLLNGFVELNE